MKNIEIRSEYPCLVKWKNGEEFLDEASVLVFDCQQRLFVYPATGRREDAAFVLDMTGKSSHAEFYELDDKQIIYLTSSQADALKVKERVMVDGKKIDFEIGSRQTTIESNERIKCVDTIAPKTYDLFSYQIFAVLIIKGKNEDQAVIFNSKTNEVTKFCAGSIEFAENELICQKFGREEKYTFSSDRLVKSKSLNFPVRNSKVLAYSFLEKIKAGEYKDAKGLLDQSLDADEEKLAAYFGEIKKVLPLNETNFLMIKKSGQYVVRLDLKDDKISNIEILD